MKIHFHPIKTNGISEGCQVQRKRAPRNSSLKGRNFLGPRGVFPKILECVSVKSVLLHTDEGVTLEVDYSSSAREEARFSIIIRFSSLLRQLMGMASIPR